MKNVTFPLNETIYCTLHTEKRQALVGRVTEILPTFRTFNKKKQLDILLNGVNVDNRDFFQINVSLQFKVQSYILKTNRFNTKPPPPLPHSNT